MLLLLQTGFFAGLPPFEKNKGAGDCGGNHFSPVHG